MAFSSLSKNKFISGIWIFVGSFIIIFIALSLNSIISNKYLLASIYSILVFILLKILKFGGQNKLPQLSKENVVRYTMICHNCNWEWMSNTTGKESPTKCPNCGEKFKLELIGYRRVQKLPKKINKELTSFFKK